jgi:hypothetical protein
VAGRPGQKPGIQSSNRTDYSILKAVIYRLTAFIFSFYIFCKYTIDLEFKQ